MARLTRRLVIVTLTAFVVIPAVANATTGKILYPPQPGSLPHNYLIDVSCAAVGVCETVGYSSSFGNPGSTRPLAERWSGGHWTVQDVPTAGPEPTLTSVSCPTENWCAAFGFGIDLATGAPGPVSYTLSRGTWTQQPVPVPSGAFQTFIQAVSCTSSNWCMAVGGDIAATDSTLAEVWDGSSWTIVPTPTTSPDFLQDLDVSCSSPSQCVAVGLNETAWGPADELWDGTSWTVGPTSPALQAISCVTGPWCAAVRPEAGTWSGGLWTSSEPPQPPAPTRRLNDVSCWAANACMTVGAYGDQDDSRPIADTLNPSSGWTIDPTPLRSGSLADAFDAVSCAGTGQCLAVGEWSPDGPSADDLYAVSYGYR